RDEDLDHLRGARRDVVSPELVDETRDGHDTAPVKEQDGQQRPLLSVAEVDRPPVDRRLERAEDRELDPRRPVVAAPLVRPTRGAHLPPIYPGATSLLSDAGRAPETETRDDDAQAA